MAVKKPAKPKIKIKTNVKAGGGVDGVKLNHNERLRQKETVKKAKIKVKTTVRAGGRTLNHNERLR